MDTEALFLTLRLATITTFTLLLIALPVAYFLAFGRTRLRFLVEALVALPLVLPPTVLGFYLLVGLGPLTAAGRIITRLLGHTLAFSFAGLLVGSMLYSLPFAVQPLVAALRGVDHRLLDAAATLGASPAIAFFRIALPLAKNGILASAVLTFAHTVGEFGVVLMLGGSLPGKTRTLSIVLFDLFENGQIKEANRIALLLLAVSTIALFVLYAKPSLPWQSRHAKEQA